jgi:hypothetical protein
MAVTLSDKVANGEDSSVNIRLSATLESTLAAHENGFFF